jgi:hypothetical protein
MTQNLSLICQICDFGSGQILQPGQLYQSPGPDSYRDVKIEPGWLARRDYFLAEVPGHVTVDDSTKIQNKMTVTTLFNGTEFSSVLSGESFQESFHEIIEYGILSSHLNPFDPME